MNSEGNMQKKRLLASLGLIITTVIWGSGFVVMKNSVDIVSPVYLMAFRFTIAGLGMVLCFFRKFKAISKEDIKPGIILGFWLFLSYVIQTYGLKYTTASNNAFITTFYVILVPFLGFFINGEKIRRKYILAGVLALLGIALLSLDGSFTVRLGDGLTLLCSLCYAVHIVFIERYTKKHDPVNMTVLQMLAAAVFCWVLAPLLEGRLSLDSFTSELVFGLIYLGIFSTMIGFLLQTVGQKYLAASTASILLSLECVFGAVFSIIFLNDPLTMRIFAGFLLVFLAIVWSQRE